jgi:ADP-heptose:LPS heptosyltransferase
MGGMGDAIARMTVVEFIIKEYPWVIPHFVVPEYIIPLYKHHFPNVDIQNLMKFDPSKCKCIIKNADIEPVSILRMHLVDQAFTAWTNGSPPLSAKNYISLNLEKIDVAKFNLPKDYAIITSLFTAEVREFPKMIVRRICRHLNNLNITPVFLGKHKAAMSKSHTITSTNNVDTGCGVDLIDKTTLLEAAKIMSNSKFVMGVDNGLLHLAATTDAPIISGYTSVDPEHRIPQRHDVSGWKYKSVVPPDNLDCKFCQSKLNFFHRDFRFCNEGTLECLRLMRADQYIEAIEDILSNNWFKTVYKRS